MKSSLDKDDPTTNYLCKREAEIGPSKAGERVQDVEKNHIRSKNVLQGKLSVIQRKGNYGSQCFSKNMSQCFSKNMSEIATTESDEEGSILDTAYLH